MSFSLGKTLKSATDYGKGLLFGSGGKATNSYTPPNVDFLKEPAAKTNYDFLRAPVDLTSGFKGYGDFYKPTTDTSTPAFGQYINAINAPSSVDAVRSGMNKEQLDLLMGDIQRDTRNKFGTELSRSFGSNLFEPGIGPSSDISANALAQIAAEGARTAAGARLQYSMADLERQAAREQAAREAYGQQYQTATSADAQSRDLAARAAAGDQSAYQQLLTGQADINNRNLLAYAQGQGENTAAENARRQAYAQILSGIAANQSQGYKPPTYGILGDFGKSFAENAGKKLGERMGG